MNKIKNYYPEQTQTLHTGFFGKETTPRSIRDLLKYHKADSPYTGNTVYGSMAEIDLGKCNLLDYLYGSCNDFALLFLQKNPKWKRAVLLRQTQTGFQLIHTFAYRKQNDRYLFADARGITDGTSEFFAEFSSEKNLVILNEEHPVADNITVFENTLTPGMLTYWTDDAGWAFHDKTIRNETRRIFKVLKAYYII